MSITVVLGFLFSAGTAFTFFDGSLFSYHPTLISIAFGIIMVGGIEFGQKASKLRYKANNIQIHMACNLLAFFIAAVGVGSIVLVKFQNGKQHFLSTHSYMAIMSILCVKVSILSGFLHGSTGKLTSEALYFHRMVASIGYICVLVCIITGFETVTVHKGVQTFVLEALFCLVFVSLFGTSIKKGHVFGKVKIWQLIVFALTLVALSEGVARFAGPFIDLVLQKVT